MRIAVVILSIVLFVGLLFFGAKTYRETVTATDNLRPDEQASELPLPAKSGPHPKVVILGGREFDFGVMEQGQESSHAFLIRNDGQATLRLLANYKGDNTCECTVGKLTRDTVPPGETVEVLVQWGVKKPVIDFAHSATIRTNDPEAMKIPFVVKGLIGRRAVIAPSSTRAVGQLANDETVKVDLTLHTETIDTFKLLKVENPGGAVTFKTRPLSAGELEQLADNSSNTTTKKEKSGQLKVISKVGGKRPTPRAGYAITATVTGAKLQPGPFQETLTFHTDLEKDHSVSFHLTGSRSGYIEFMKAQGAKWDSQKLLLRLGTFQATKGKSVRVPMLLKEVTPETKLQVIGTKPDFMKVKFERDPEFPAKTKHRYWMTLTVPPGQPPVTLTARRHGTISLETKGGEKRSLRFFVGFVSH
ncbi:MAG: hypothetical protein CMJ65_17440 [Planctomycetaceae bacterium]|jgi:hypothetical protein|nr:hypothetical protein [Planctomycetaceae bacterium]MDP7276326.1 DUF1573 domain-containing protein [Planctomycetaceae bacterium]